MTSPRQIGWSKKAILLYEISKQLEKLEGVWSNVTITDVEEIPLGAIMTDDGLNYVLTDDGMNYILAG